MSTNEYSIAFSEVLNILQNSEIEVIAKIPLEIIKKIKEKSSKEYNAKINTDNDFEPSQKAKAILAVLYQDYLCEEDELEEFNQQLLENEKSYQEALRKKYNPDKLFEKSIAIEGDSTNAQNMQMIEYKESILKKVINKIKMLFKRID